MKLGKDQGLCQIEQADLTSVARHRGNRTTDTNVELGMNRRSFLAAVVVSPVIAALAACGDPNQSPVATEPTTLPTASTTAPVAGIVHPTGADDVVLRLAYEGGFVPAGYAFVSTPSLLVSGDGRVFTPGILPAIFPGPLLPAVMVRTITEDGVQAMLGIVQDAGLLAAPPEYPDRHNVADAPNTVLEINAAGSNFVHSAYALGMGDPETGTRQSLLDATTKLADVEAAAGAPNVGVEQPFVPTAYRFQARAIDPAELAGQEPAPSVVAWPAEAGVALASATTCARLDAAAVGSLFLDAKQNTYFKEGDVVYQLAVAGVLPGDPEC